MKKLVIASIVLSCLTSFGISHLNFGKIEGTNATFVTYAPSALMVNGVYTGEAILSTNDYLNAGWRILRDITPKCDEKHYATATGWILSDTSYIDRTYAIHEYPPEPARKIYKYDLSVAAMEYGEITNLITYISSDIGVKWMWDAAEILVEDDPFFISATNSVISSGVIPEQKVKSILDRAYELGQTPNTEAK